MPIGGGDGGAAIPLATGRPKPQAIAVDGLDVYWLEPGATTSGALRSCPLAGCPGNTPKVVYGMLGPPYGLALDSTNVYLTTSAGRPGAVLRQVHGREQHPRRLAGRAVGHRREGRESLLGHRRRRRVFIQVIGLTAGGTSSHVATTMGAPQAVAADAVNVYWSDNSPGLSVTTLGPVDSLRGRWMPAAQRASSSPSSARTRRRPTSRHRLAVRLLDRDGCRQILRAWRSEPPLTACESASARSRSASSSGAPAWRGLAHRARHLGDVALVLGEQRLDLRLDARAFLGLTRVGGGRYRLAACRVGDGRRCRWDFSTIFPLPASVAARARHCRSSRTLSGHV